MMNQSACKEQKAGYDWAGLLLFFALGFILGRHIDQVHINIIPTVMSTWLGMTFCMLKVILLLLMAFIGFLTFLCSFCESCKDLYKGDELLMLILLPISALSTIPVAAVMWYAM